MAIPTSSHGRAYPKSSQGVNVFSAGGRRSRRRPRVSGSSSLESPQGLKSGAITTTTATVTCFVNNYLGDVYVVVDADTGIPTPEQVFAGLAADGLAATFDGVDAAPITGGNVSIDVTGLTLDTLYFFHFVQDIDGALTPVASSSFTTAAV